VLDETSKKIIYNVVKEDDILNKNIASRSAPYHGQIYRRKQELIL